MIQAPVLHFQAVLPLLLISAGAFAALLLELFLKARPTFLGRPVTPVFVGSCLSLVSVFFLALIVAVACSNFVAGGSVEFNPAHPMIRLDRFANFSIAAVSLASLLSCLLSTDYLREMRINHGEYYTLLLLATSGMILLVSAVDLMTIFLGIEILSIPIYVLAGFDRNKLRSNESALKYFVVGSFASAVLLYGMALLYGATGATQLDAIRAGLADPSPLATIGLAFLLVGFTFKISSVPFHQWTPDVYEGAPTSVTAWMSVTVKLAAFAALLRVTVGVLDVAGAGLRDVLWVLAALTMVVGNVMAVVQDNAKRLLAYSSVAHAGYLLMGFVAGTVESWAAVLFYLVVYLFMNLGAFGVLVALADRGQDAERVDDLAGLYRRRPVLAIAMLIFMLSLAGIPGTGGFLAKLYLFMAAVKAGYVGLTVIAVIASLVSVYYYLRIPVVMFMREPAEDVGQRRPLHTAELAVLGVCVVAVIVLGVFPNNGPWPVSWVSALDWTRSSVQVLASHPLP